MRPVLFLLAPALGLSLLAERTPKAPKPPKAPKVRVARAVNASEAKAIAERETGGHAVSAHRIPLNGATGGWEVTIRMPKEDRGWSCIVDNDTHMVYRKTRIPNPPSGRSH